MQLLISGKKQEYLFIINRRMPSIRNKQLNKRLCYCIKYHCNHSWI